MTMITGRPQPKKRVVPQIDDQGDADDKSQKSGTADQLTLVGKSVDNGLKPIDSLIIIN